VDPSRRRAAPGAALAAADSVRRDALGTVLFRLGVSGLGHDVGHLGADRAGDPVDAAGVPGPTLPAARLENLDAGTVAAWFTDQLPAQPCDTVVIGSPHGAALHLAAAMGAPWLPASFDIGVEFSQDDPDHPLAALTAGLAAAAGVLRANDDVMVRQVHDPVPHRNRLAGLALTVRWQQLPTAYGRYLDRNLAPGGSVVLVRDVGRWPVVRRGERFSFQLGSRANGLDPLQFYRPGDGVGNAVRAVGGRGVFDDDLRPFCDGDTERGVEVPFVDDLRWWARDRGRRLRQVLYRRPEVLSATVADMYRLRLRHAGRTGNRLVVECGRLLSPLAVLRAGLVPYWCEHPLRSAVAAAEWWLAGSDEFNSVEVLPEPPGAALSTMAELAHWGSVASFAGRRGLVDSGCAESYPLGAVRFGHAGAVLGRYRQDAPMPPPLTPDGALAVIAAASETSGLLVL